MTNSEVHLNIVEVRKPEIDANLVAESIAQQLERRVAFRRAMKRAVQSAMRIGAEGIRINAAAVWAAPKSRVPNGTAKAGCRCTRLRADIDYGVATAHTAYGTNGVKVWIFKGEILEHDPMASERRAYSTGRRRSTLAVAVIVKAPATDGCGSPETVRQNEQGIERCCSQSAQSSASSTRAASTAMPRAVLS
jgi:ribosomal protein S3